jgi:transposase InsO family protein
MQVDTLDARSMSGPMLKQFSARCVVSAEDLLDVRSAAAANLAKEFLEVLEDQTPLPIKAIHVDEGSEFQGHYAAAGRELRNKQDIYNDVRPHLSLAGRTPLQYLMKLHILLRAFSPPPSLS